MGAQVLLQQGSGPEGSRQSIAREGSGPTCRASVLNRGDPNAEHQP